jgi:hypothetical protein
MRRDWFLDWRQQPMRLLRELDADRVARSDVAADQHDGHDAGLADETAVRAAL